MDVHASEKEQIEALKKWWKENGSSIITGLLLGVSILLGGKAWFSYQETQALSASNIYAQMMAASNRNETEMVRQRASELITNYTGSAYAPLASLLLAKLAVQDNELAAAQAQLQWALDHAASVDRLECPASEAGSTRIQLADPPPLVAYLRRARQDRSAANAGAQRGGRARATSATRQSRWRHDRPGCPL